MNTLKDLKLLRAKMSIRVKVSLRAKLSHRAKVSTLAIMTLCFSASTHMSVFL